MKSSKKSTAPEPKDVALTIGPLEVLEIAMRMHSWEVPRDKVGEVMKPHKCAKCGIQRRLTKHRYAEHGRSYRTSFRWEYSLDGGVTWLGGVELGNMVPLCEKGESSV